MLQGIDKVHPHKPKVRNAVTVQMLPHIFKRINEVIDNEYDQLLYKAVMSLMVHSLVRPCEILSTSQYKMDSTQQLLPGALSFRRDKVTLRLILDVVLKRRKTSKNAEVTLPPLVQNYTETCPVMNMSTFLTLRERVYHPQQPVFILASGHYVSRQSITDFIKLVAPNDGVTAGWSSYGTRIGGTTSLAAIDCTTEYIKQKGGWKGDTYLRYVSGYNPEYDVGVQHRLAASGGNL